MENSNDVQNTTNLGNEVLSDVSTRLDFVWKLMGEKGLTLGERMQVRGLGRVLVNIPQVGECNFTDLKN